MELRQLKAFRAIVVTGNFSVAADQVHLTRSALSHQIKNLERELGKPLLIRAKPKVYPTPAGQILLMSVSRVLAELASMQQNFGVTSDDFARSNIRVAAANTGLLYIYGDLCERFLAHYPKIELTITATETTDEAVLRVSRRAADVAFTTLPIDVANLETVRLGRAEQVFIVGRNHRLARRRRVSLDTIRDYAFIRYQAGSGGRVLSDQVFLSGGGYPPIMMETNDTEVVKRIAAMGVAVALVPAFTVAREIRTRHIYALRLTSGRLMQPFGFVHFKDLRTQALDAFKAHCLELRGPRPVELTLERIGRAAWTRA